MNLLPRTECIAVRPTSTNWMPGLVLRVLGAALLAGGAWAADTAPSAADASAPAATRNSVPPVPALAAKTAASPGARPPSGVSPYTPNRFSGRAGLYYATIWGIDSISVKLVESGELVRFSYRVVDPDKVGPLHDKQNEATLEDPKAGVSLVVPSMEKVGQLRQTPAPVAGRSYWMTFSNKGRRVARGDRVDVVIGPFKANNLVVD